MNKAVFLDKDGTLILNKAYNVNPDYIALEENIKEGLKRLQAEGFKFIVITNQAGVAYGYFKEKELKGVQKEIERLLGKEGIPLDGFYYCPHHPEGKIKKYAISCSCRKPAPGMLVKAAMALDINLSQSWMIGDILDDVEAGNRAGCKTILIDNGHETEWEMAEKRIPDLIARSINDAAKLILITEKVLLP